MAAIAKAFASQVMHAKRELGGSSDVPVFIVGMPRSSVHRIASALVAGLVWLLAANFPYKTGLLLAALIGIITGLVIEGRPK